LQTFAEIYQRAAQRKGGADALEELLPKPNTPAQLTRVSDDRYLAEMTRCVFRSGFVWQVIDNKWPGFEAAFGGFDVTSCAMLSDEDLEQLAADTRIVRNAAKIAAVRGNANFIRELRASHGGCGAYLAAWPAEDIVGLWDELKRRGSRLGGHTGAFFLRFVGKDTFMLSADVVQALQQQGVVDKAPTSRKALAAVQTAFNRWHDESSRSLSEISRTLACSVG
jgi:3-methyladenine DNA glycosylase Tag